MTDRELMQQALGKMEYMLAHGEWYEPEKTIAALRDRLAQPEQEPVAWANSNDLQNFDMRVRTNGGPLHTVPLYTTPPQRKPLTDEEIEKIAKPFWDGHLGYGYADFDSTEFARAIEAAHGITE